MLRRRDWRALIRYGVIFFLLEKLGAAVGTTNLHIYAAMRGQSLADFQKTRNAQVLYSVAGRGFRQARSGTASHPRRGADRSTHSMSVRQRPTRRPRARGGLTRNMRKRDRGQQRARAHDQRDELQVRGRRGTENRR